MSHPENDRRERDRRERSRLQHEAEHARPHKKVSVMGYLAILFAAAFLLLLLSYFMQQRVNREAIDGLTDSSISAMQSLDNLISQKDSLEEEVADLKQRLTQLEQENNSLQSTIEHAGDLQTGLDRQLEAMDWFWRIQREASRGQYGAARKLIEAFEATGLPSSLPTTNPADPDGRTPAEQYRAVVDLLT